MVRTGDAAPTEQHANAAAPSSVCLAGACVTRPFALIVTDTSPLFTLVLADALDTLLRPGLAISIPDAVYIEATRVHGAPGAGQIVEWINAHLEQVRIVPTDIGIDQQRGLEEGRSIRGLGEQADRDAGAVPAQRSGSRGIVAVRGHRRRAPPRHRRSACRSDQHRRFPARTGGGRTDPVHRPHS